MVRSVSNGRGDFCTAANTMTYRPVTTSECCAKEPARVLPRPGRDASERRNRDTLRCHIGQRRPLCGLWGTRDVMAGSRPPAFGPPCDSCRTVQGVCVSAPVCPVASLHVGSNVWATSALTIAAHVFSKLLKGPAANASASIGARRPVVIGHLLRRQKGGHST
jgi:hypothetical protein